MTRSIFSNSPSVLEVDLDAIGRNTRHIRQLVGSDCRLYCALKCGAYGLGLVPVARTILNSGGDAVSVARPGDALALREAGIDAPILLYPSQAIDLELTRFLGQCRVATAIWDEASLVSLSRHAEADIDVLLKVDVGLRRLGVPPEIALDYARRIKVNRFLHLKGLFCHPHVPVDPIPDGYLEWQFARFRRSVEDLVAAGFDVPIRMAASSAVLRLTAELNLTAVDPGRLHFAFVPDGPATSQFEWKQPLHAFRTELISVKDIEADQFSSFSPIPIGEGIRIGVIPLGTSDGLLTASAGHVLVRGRPAPLLSAVSLEHARIDLREHRDARVGDEVIIIGTQGGASVSLQEVAKHRGIPPQMVTSGIGPAVKRAYVQRSSQA